MKILSFRSCIVIALLLLSSFNVNGANRLYCDDVTLSFVPKGQLIVLPIQIESDVDITSLQCDLYLPAGVSVYSVSTGNVASSSHQVKKTVLDGFTRLVCYSSSKEFFLERQGVVIQVVLSVNSSVSVGSYEIFLKDIFLSDASVPAIGYEVPSFTASLNIESRILVSSITLSDVTVGVGMSTSIPVSISPSNAYNQTLLWTSLDESVVNVDQNGVVTGVKAGSARVRAMSTDGNQITGFCWINVKEIIQFEDNEVERICLDKWDGNNDGVLTKEEASKVTSISSSIFSNNTKIRKFNELQLFEKVTRLDRNAFSGCSNLEEITFPASLNTIGNDVFNGCCSLSDVFIPAACTSISNSAFRGCSSIQSFSVEYGNSVYDSRDNCNAILNNDNLEHGCINTIIPDGIKTIKAYAFSDCSSLTEIGLPSSLTTIFGNAFENCTSLRKIEVPQSVNNVYSDAFVGCTDVEVIIVNSNNQTYDSRENCNALIKTFGSELVLGCSATRIPNSIKKICSHAFYQCSTLNAISIPQSVETIESNSFSVCPLLKDVYVEWDNPFTPNVGDDAFSPANVMTLHVPSQAVSYYKSSPKWSVFKEIVELAPKDLDPTDISSLTDAIYASAKTVSKGSTAMLTINLKNAQRTNGYSFDLKLPTGVTLAKDNSDEYVYTLSPRHNGHVATVNYKEASGVYGFAVMSLSSKDVKESDGVILTLTLNISDEMSEGDYAVKIQNARYSLSSGATSVAMENVTSLLTVESYIKGDANGDSMVDIADAVCIVNHIVGKATPSFIEAAADANGDGVVDIADAVRIVNLIVGKIDALGREHEVETNEPE